MKNKSFKLLIFALVMSFGFIPNVYAYCPLGPDVTKDLYGVLKIINYAAPIICIAFTILDLIKSLTKGDSEAELKPVAMKLGKRLAYTIILFFIPMLVDQFMQLAGVWGEDGGCDLQNPGTPSETEEDPTSPSEAMLDDYSLGEYYIEMPNSILL